jgi:hypothetical protein
VFSNLVFGVDEVESASAVILRTIDEAGNFVGTNTKYFDDHPVYGGIAANVVANGQDMAFIPPFYIKFWRDPENAKHVRYFISPHEKEGFALHPAFRVADAAGGFLYARCLNTVAYDAAASPNSLKSSADNIAGSFTLAYGQTMCANMNTGGESGWHVVTIWEDRAIELLLRMEGLTYFPQQKWGGEAWTSVPPTSPLIGKWRDIYAFWGNSNSIDNKILAGINIPAISVPESPEIPMHVGLAATNGSTTGWEATIQTGFNAVLGIDIDLLLLPLTVVSSSALRNVYTASAYNTSGSVTYQNNSIGIGKYRIGSGSAALRIAKWL